MAQGVQAQDGVPVPSLNKARSLPMRSTDTPPMEQAIGQTCLVHGPSCAPPSQCARRDNMQAARHWPVSANKGYFPVSSVHLPANLVDSCPVRLHSKATSCSNGCFRQYLWPITSGIPLATCVFSLQTLTDDPNRLAPHRTRLPVACHVNR